MITALQGLTAKSAAGQRRLPGDGLALPQDVFRQTPLASVIDERQHSEWRPLDWAQSRGRITPCEEIASMCLGAKWPLLSPVELPLEGEAQRAGRGSLAMMRRNSDTSQRCGWRIATPLGLAPQALSNIRWENGRGQSYNKHTRSSKCFQQKQFPQALIFSLAIYSLLKLL